jgi:hypothetical protein
MKKIRYVGQLILALLFVYTASLSAQIPIKFGIKFGGNFAVFAGKDTAGTSFLSKFAGNVGAYGTYKVNDMWAVQGELLLTQKGARGLAGTNSTLNYKYYYLEVPVLAKGMITYHDQLFYGLIGPYLDIKVHDSYGFSGPNNKALQPYVAPKSSEFGFMLGVGTATTDQKLSAEVRFSHGLTKVDKNGSDLKSEVWSVMIGYGFN